MKAYSVV